MDILIGIICVSVGICIGFFFGYKSGENVLTVRFKPQEEEKDG